MEKSYFLSESDNQKFGNIYIEEMVKKPEQELKDIYTKLKKEYNINQPSLNIFIRPLFKQKVSKLEKKEIAEQKTEYAAYVYIRVIYSLVRGKRKTDNKFSEEFSRYFENHISKLEKSIQYNDSDDQVVIANLFFYLSMLDDFYREYNDKNGYIQTTYKLYKIYSISNLNLFKIQNEDYYSDAKAGFISRALDLNEKNFFFGDNEKLFKSYILALATSDDSNPVLILGETGTGKENLAKRIHDVSLRRKNSFQVLNCAAIPETLFDPEISGIIKGAGTNITTRLGVFLAACNNKELGYYIENKNMIFFKTIKGKTDKPTESELRKVGGTIFLDEINSVPLFLQAKLLRNIEENEVRVVGEDRTRKVNVKLICASNTNLYHEVVQKNFRADLYYRISGQTLRLPSLREMKDSLIRIAEYKLSQIVKEIGYDKKIEFSKSAENKIQNYDWPGNFRELNNILYRAINEIRIEGKNIISGSHIVFDSTDNQSLKTIDNFLADMQFEELEKRYVTAVMKRAGGNETKAAQMAGFGNSRTRLQTRLKKYGIKFKE